ncbi:MAG: hypothetical protein FWF79_05395 [Defluviitaleaceae bacterium]|nr:hypothetical protein [Defluviitaleaceae bacterium]
MSINDYGRNHSPREITLNPIPWLIVFLGSEDNSGDVDCLLESAKKICETNDSVIKSYNIPDLEYYHLHKASLIRDRDVFETEQARFKTYVIEKILNNRNERKLPDATEVAVVFNGCDFTNAEVFKNLRMALRIANYLPICSDPRPDYSLKKGACGNCNKDDCSGCKYGAVSEHSCIQRLFSRLLCIDIDDVKQIAEVSNI